MARIALTAGAGIAGAFLLPGVGFWAGLAIGSSAGSVVSDLLFRPRVPGEQPIQGLQVSSSANGAPIPFGYGRMRYAGQIIWSAGIDTHTTEGDNDGFGTGSTTAFTYSSSFAAAFGEGPATIERIWADTKLIYKGGQPFGFFDWWDPATPYQADDLVSYTVGSEANIYKARVANQGQFPTNLAYWTIDDTAEYSDSPMYMPGQQVSRRPGGNSALPGLIYAALRPTQDDDPESSPDDWAPISAYYGSPTVYPGDEAQMPDPLIQAHQGIANVSAHRGLCYAVWEDFPLANFANRLPNIRAEISFEIQTLPEAIEDICERSGLVVMTQVDVSELSNNITPTREFHGFLVERPQQAAELLRALNLAYFLDTCESDGVLRWVPRAGAEYIQSASVDELFGSGGPASDTLLPFPAENTEGNLILALLRGDQAPGITDDADDDFTELFHLTGHFSGYVAVAKPFDGVRTVTSDRNGFVITHTNLHIFEIASSPAPAVVTNSGTGGTASIADAAGCTTLTVQLGASAAWQIALLTFNRGFRILFVNVATGDDVDPGGNYVPDGWTEAHTLPWSRTFYQRSPYTIPTDDLGLREDNAQVTEQIMQEQDLPQRVTVLYNEALQNYEQGKQEKTRTSRIVQTKNQRNLQLNLTLTKDQARRIAEVKLISEWIERATYALNLWKARYMLLDPTDVVEFIYQELTFEMRIMANSLGQGFSTQLEGVSTNTRAFLSTVVGGSSDGFVPPELPEAPITLLFLRDIPLIQDGDSSEPGTGFYFALTSAQDTWPGAALYRSSDDSNFTQIGDENSPAGFGYAIDNALGGPASPWTWDDVNELTVYMPEGQLTGTTDLNVLNGANMLLYGDEIIQFANAVNNGDGSFTISRLLRGRRGTEWACGDHVNDEEVIVLDDAQHMGQPLSMLEALRYYRGVTVGQDVSEAASQTFTITGMDLMPYAPVHIEGTRPSDLVITWVRRTRIGGDWLDGVGDVPLSEASELYDVEIMDGVDVVRTFSDLTSPTVTYTVAQQTTDFGSPPATVDVRVYQKSAIVGRGFTGTATL